MQQQQQPYYDTMSVPPPPSYMSTTHGGGSSSMPPPPPPLPPQAPDLSSRSSAGLAQHSRTSSASGGFGKSPAHPEGNGTPKGGPLAHKYSEDDMLNHSYHHLPAPNGGPDAASPDPRYHQLLSEYRRMCQINEQLMQQQHPQQQQQQQQGSIGSRSGSGSAWRGTGPPPPPPPPPQEFSGASNAGYWNPGTMSYPPYPTVAVGHSPQVGGSSTANGFPATPTANAIDNRMPSFGASAANPASPLPQSPKAPVQAQSSPTTKGPSKLSAPPQSGLPVKKVSKKQQEAQAEAMTKEAYITHLERLIQQKDELLAKFEGKEPDVLDSAVQATVWTAVARTQTGGDDEDEDSDGFNKDDSPLDSKAMSTDGKCLLLETQNILVQCGFTTLRPLTLQLHADAATGGGGLGGGASHGNMGASYTGGIGIGSPQPRWAHRPYGLTKKRSSGQISVDSTGDAAPSSELLVPMPGNLRWADEPCDLDLAPPTPDRRGASITGAGTSTSSWRGDSQGGRGTWRGGSRATARQSAAQTL